MSAVCRLYGLAMAHFLVVLDGDWNQQELLSLSQTFHTVTIISDVYLFDQLAARRLRE